MAEQDQANKENRHEEAHWHSTLTTTNNSSGGIAVWGTCPIKVRILAPASCRSMRLEPRAGMLGAAVALPAEVGLGEAGHSRLGVDELMGRWMKGMRRWERRNGDCRS